MKTCAYHGTCQKYLKNIRENGLDPKYTKYRQDHWLGQGVYFFEDYNKALWWARTTSKQNSNCGSVVFEANIIASDEKVLDLDDFRQLDAFMDKMLEVYEQIKKECIGEMPIFDEGNIRGVFFDYYKQIKNISVVIATFKKDFAGYTKKRNKEEKSKQSQIMKVLGVQYSEKQICVSEKGCIHSVTLAYSEKGEV